MTDQLHKNCSIVSLRQQKLEKVMDQEGLADEDVSNMDVDSLSPEILAYLSLSCIHTNTHTQAELLPAFV